MNATTTLTADTSTVHPFERAGLGKAPFRYLGCRRLVGPLRFAQADGTVLEVGAEGQPMGTCSFCSQGIAECHSVKSADGKRFTVGCDCIARIHGDERTPLRSAAEAASRKLRNAAAKARRDAKATTEQVELAALLADEAARAKLAALPGPKFGTMLEHAEFMATRAGATGRAKALKAVKAALG
jgi:hypothetical protein